MNTTINTEDNTGFWYFTLHGIGPGTLPKGVTLLKCLEGANRKGTHGDYLMLDRALTDEEIRYYDLQKID